jgi:hypothetical protein
MFTTVKELSVAAVVDSALVCKAHSLLRLSTRLV